MPDFLKDKNKRKGEVKKWIMKNMV
jgi:hypothetical protein